MPFDYVKSKVTDLIRSINRFVAEDKKIPTDLIEFNDNGLIYARTSDEVTEENVDSYKMVLSRITKNVRKYKRELFVITLKGERKFRLTENWALLGHCNDVEKLIKIQDIGEEW